MTSNAEVDSIIDKYNLRGFYGKQYIEDACKDLLAHSEISEDKKSGLVQIRFTAKDKVLAHDHRGGDRPIAIVRKSVVQIGQMRLLAVAFLVQPPVAIRGRFVRVVRARA